MHFLCAFPFPTLLLFSVMLLFCAHHPLPFLALQVLPFLTPFVNVIFFLFVFVFWFFFCLFRVTPTANEGSQARDLIEAVAAGLRHSRSNARSEPRLQPTPQLTATPDP